MKFWDSSALIPLVVKEEGTDLVRAWLKEDDQIITWALTRLELAGAVERRARQGAIDTRDRRLLLKRFEELAAGWDEVRDLLPVVKRGVGLLARHGLRAADAAQLGAALLVSEGDPSTLPFVCLDRNLADAAEREGFPVLGWPD